MVQDLHVLEFPVVSASVEKTLTMCRAAMVAEVLPLPIAHHHSEHYSKSQEAEIEATRLYVCLGSAPYLARLIVASDNDNYGRVGRSSRSPGGGNDWRFGAI